MNEVGVIFDTNAYRSLVYGLNTEQQEQSLSRLKELESKFNVTTYAYPFVMLELAAHLADPKDVAYNHCKNASIALVSHTTKFDEGLQRRVIWMIADSESQLCVTLHKQEPEGNRDTMERLNNLFMYLSANRAEAEIDKIRGDFKEISGIVENVENQFVADFWRSIVNTFQPDAKDWQPLAGDKVLRKKILGYLNTEDALFQLAKMNVIKTYNLLKKPSDGKVDEMAKVVLDEFRPPLLLYNEIVKRLVMSGFDLTKDNRKNFVWDIQIAFLIGKNLRQSGKELRLISADQMIIKAAQKAGCGNLVYSLDEYREKLVHKKPL